MDIHPSQLLGSPYVLKDYDLHTVTLEEMKNLDVPFNLRVLDSGPTGPAEVGSVPCFSCFRYVRANSVAAS